MDISSYPDLIGTDIDKAARLLREGSVVSIPTETVYGLAANAFDEKAVLEVFKAKNRPFFDPLIIHVHSVAAAAKYVTAMEPLAYALAEAVWPGPLTLLLPKKETIPYLVTSGSSFVAVRVPDHPLTLELLEKLDLPLAAPSANPFGYISPTTAEHVAQQLGGKIPYIVNGGACKVGLESTIVQVENGEIMVLRLGGLSLEKISEITGVVPHVAVTTHSNPKAPGQLDKHYAPRTPLLVTDQITTAFKSIPENSRIGLLSFTKEYTELPFAVTAILSSNSNLDEAAMHLFGAMRYLDTQNLDIIVSEKFPEMGLGLAINDRLKRAAAK